MLVMLNNNAVSKLASSITTGGTAMSVTSGEGSRFPSPTAGGWFPLTIIKSSGALEIVRCTARSGDVLTVTRAQEGTAAQSFSAGDRVELRLTAAAFAEPITAQDAAIAAVQDQVTASVSFRNKLINPKGAINQRAYVSGMATVAANQYTLDRWRVVTSGQSLSFAASGNSYLITAPAGGVEQVIEGTNIEGGIYTLSWSGTATATVNGVAIANGGQTTSLTAGSNVTVKFINGTFMNPQFQAGPVTMPFEQRPTSFEIGLCKRYFEKTVGTAFITQGTPSLAYTTTPVYWEVEKRATPTVSTGTVLVGGNTWTVAADEPRVNMCRLLFQQSSAGGGNITVEVIGAAEL